MALREHYSLRPMNDADADMVRAWRNSESVRPYMYTTHEISEAEHRAWWERVKDDARTHYFIFEMDGRPLGVANVVRVDSEHGTAEWGFYLGDSSAPPGSGSVMEFLTLEEAFERLGVRKLSCEVLSYNERPLKMHHKFGFVQEGLLREHKLHDGQYEDVIVLALFARDWPAVAESLAPTVFRE